MMRNARPAVLAYLVACSVQLEPPDGALIRCQDAGECPEGLRCDIEIQICVPLDPSGAPPGLSGAAVVSPNAVGADKQLAVTFSSDRPLAVAPHVEVRAGASVAALALLAGQAAGPYLFAYQTTGSEPEGVATLTAVFTDLQGLRATVQLGTTTFDFTPPRVTGVIFDSARAAAGSTWLDAVAPTARPQLAVGEPNPSTLEIGGDVLAPVAGAYQASLAVPLSAGDGEKLVQFVFTDAAANVTSLPVSLRLDTALPSNTVVIEIPAVADLWLNALSITLFFHSLGPLPPDFAAHVVSTDGGQSWTPATSLGTFTVTQLMQDADTTLWVREQDVFDNQTPASAQAELLVHEDSQPPTPPEPLTALVAGNLSSETGVLVSPSVDPGGGPVVYQLVGGPFADYTSVGAGPAIELPGARPSALTVYVLRAIDRAGNASPGATVTVADDPLLDLEDGCLGDCVRSQWTANGTRGLYYRRSAGNHSLVLCRQTSLVTASCDSSSVATGPFVDVIHDISATGRHLLYENSADGTSTLYALDIGADGTLGSTDDGAPVSIDDGHCVAAGQRGFVYGRGASPPHNLHYWSYGADGVPATGDAGEGATLIDSSNPVSPLHVTIQACPLHFNGRHIVWSTGTGSLRDYFLYDLGPNGAPGGGDDSGPIPLGQNSALVLGAHAYYRFQKVGADELVELGPDDTLGTGDDVSTQMRLDSVSSMSAGKMAAVSQRREILYDLSSGTSMFAHNSVLGDSAFGLHLGDGLLFASVRPTFNVEIPAFHRFWGEPLAYRFSADSVLALPSGWRRGDFFLFRTTPNTIPTLVNLSAGGTWQLTEDLLSVFDVDLGDGKVVWTRLDATLQLYDVGPDRRPGTADDRGPVTLPTSDFPRQPRIDGNVVVWAEIKGTPVWLSSSAGPVLDSTLHGIDLGADGWLGGGDDVQLTLTTGGKEVMPEVSAGRVSYLDFSVDASGKCEVARGGGAPDPDACTPALRSVNVASGALNTIDATPVSRLWLFALGDTLVWQEWGGPGNAWDIYTSYQGGTPVAVAATPANETRPVLYGSKLAYYVQGPVVVDAGGDGRFGTPDDQVLRDDTGINPVLGITTDEESRYRWLGAEGVAMGGGVLPPDDKMLRIARGGGTIPDNGAPLSDSVTVTAAPWQWVEQMRVHVVMSHPTPAELMVTLTSPSGEAVTLWDRASAAPQFDQIFTLGNAPQMLDHWGEPLAGDWTLRITDTVPGNAGTLTRWTLIHRK